MPEAQGSGIMKSELLDECREVLERPLVEQFYERYMERTSQRDTIKVLQEGIRNGLIDSYEALCISLLVGIQWNVKFEGTP